MPNPAAYGLALGPDILPLFTGFGMRGVHGTLLPPGGNAAIYLRSTGIQDQDPPEINNRLVTTLAKALEYARANKSDTIYVLPGHAENVTDATMLDNLRAGTRIVGVGHGTNKPTFTWTATGGQWTVDQSDVSISGLRLSFDGANGIVKAVNVTGAFATIMDNDIVLASAATAKATIGIEFGAGSGYSALLRNRFLGSAGHNVTDGVLVASAVDGISILGNLMVASATSANGLIRSSAAATNMLIGQNIIYNTMTAAALVGIALGTAACTGICWGNRIGCLTGGAMTSGTHGISFGGSVDFRFFDNLVSDSVNADGIGIITDAA